MKKYLVVLIFLISITSLSVAQRVLAYYPYYVTGEETNVQYDKLTDIVYAFLQLDGNGNLASGNYFNTTQFAQIRDLAQGQGVRVHVSVGGGGAPTNDLAWVAADPIKRATMVGEITSFLAGNHTLNSKRITGIDVDWEFPTDQTKRDNHEALLSELRTAIDAQGQVDGVHYELSIAIGADVKSPTGHDDYINPAAFQYPDLVSVMAYDLSYLSTYGGHHSSMQAAIDATERYMQMGLSGSKVMIGVPFYGRTSGGGASAYKSINSSASQSIFENDFTSPYYYNGKDLIEQKIDYVMATIGGQGITCWELTQDRTDQYSLLAAGYDYMQQYACAAPKPNLGADQSICGTSSVILNSDVSTGAGRTFTWKRNGTAVVTNSGTQTTYTATSAGTYTVEVNEGGCFNEDVVEVLGVLPAVDLGADQVLCNPSIITLDAGVAGAGVRYEWEKDTEVLTVTTQTLDVIDAGNYTVTVSDNTGGCSDVSDQINITSNLIAVQGDQLCQAGTANLSVAENNGTYTWYDQVSGGNLLSTGTTYMPSVSQSTMYYVELEATGGQNCLGLATYDPLLSYSGGVSLIYNGERWTANWWVNPGNSPDNPGGPTQWTNNGPCSSGAGCDRTPVLAEVAVCTGLFDENELSIDVLPNPFSDYVIVDTQEDENATLTISTLSGQVVMSQNITPGRSEVNTSSLSKGVYLIDVISSQAHMSKRFIKD